AQMYETVRIKPQKRRFAKKPWAINGCSGRKPNSLKSLFLTPGVLEAHNWKLASKFAKIEKREIRFEQYWCSDSSYILVSYGTCARIAKEAVQRAREEGIDIGLFRPITLWPFPYAQLREYIKNAKKILVVEMNLGQMIDDVKIAAANSSARIFFYGRPGGGIPDPDEIYREIKKK
ncbi:MAG TPA: transketolase C-terminal domain-containing protein, partial [bacterium]|nr:transketolase C-terminal domain-containing protein [bacterium]